jgi:hypothetical protein
MAAPDDLYGFVSNLKSLHIDARMDDVDLSDWTPMPSNKAFV